MMDMTTCVARRTRSRTESYLNSILNRSSPARAKRRRKSVTEDEDNKNIYPQGKRVQEDRVCDFALNEDNSVESSDSSYIESDEVGGAKVTKRPSKKVHTKKNDSDVFELLTKSIRQERKISENETAKTPTVRESSSEMVYEQEIITNWRFGCEEEPEPVEKTQEEKETERLWEEMALALGLEGVQTSSSSPVKNSCSNGTHDLVLDEEIGLICRNCSYVAVEIKNISPAMDKNHSNVYGKKKTYNDKISNTLLTELEFKGLDHCTSYVDNPQGTVWDYIPGVKDTLFPHQQEGFEFIWNNLAGTTKLHELSRGTRESGGCIISHSPGTGKTRLTIVFLQSYLERFPDCHPVVIAPASVLLTWEQEFKKWNADIPFYNMNSLELSGHEDESAVSLLNGNKNNNRSVRMVKLYSWKNKKSVLLISYPLYEKLARETQEYRKMLLELPGLLVLDEGHIARNQSSRISKVLTEVRTEKRIILSGTPFQNNFKELSNVLCLARPAYVDSISLRLQDLSKWSNNGRFYEELRAMIAPFVHVHKKNVLGESLPGLRDCVVVLNPSSQQQKILAEIDLLQNTFELEHKLSAVSVHPSLYLQLNSTTKEQFSIGPKALETLEKLRLESKEGAKTRFLIDLIRLSEILKEKVLVFSQYIDTLKLVKDQLSAVFGWTEGGEILFMHGQVKQKDRQHLIKNFNKPDSKSKVLLASTGACSEGIHLVGASRVVFLDVVWNPSVEKQAISRAYRNGQKRVVYSYHLMVKGTYEWDKYCKQTKKHRISELVFSSTNEKDKMINKEVVSEDRILDEMVRHEKHEDMFEKIVYHPKESTCLPTSSD